MKEGVSRQARDFVMTNQAKQLRKLHRVVQLHAHDDNNSAQSKIINQHVRRSKQDQAGQEASHPTGSKQATTTTR